MIPTYDEKKEKLYIIHKLSQHFPPHLHETPEFIYITNGTLELGIEQEFFHMEKGDFAIIFPNIIHHYQVFTSCTNSAFYVYSPLTLTGQFRADLQKYSPKNPVIHRRSLPVDILNAIQCLDDEKNVNPIIEQAYVQIILARSMPLFKLEERSVVNSGDIIYQTVCSMLEYSDQPITEICLDAGFQSQRTFNRAFQEVYRMTPREYRNRYKERYVIKAQPENI